MKHMNRDSGLQDTIEKTVKIRGSRDNRGHSISEGDDCSYLIPVAQGGPSVLQAE